MLGLEIYHMKKIAGKTSCMKKDTIEQPICTSPFHIDPEGGCYLVLKFVELEDKE